MFQNKKCNSGKIMADGLHGPIMKGHSQKDNMTEKKDIHNYSHAAALSDLDKMDKELESLKESLVNNSVRCHILEVDLATQFGPDIQACVQNTKQDCSSCKDKLSDILDTGDIAMEEQVVDGSGDHTSQN